MTKPEENKEQLKIKLKTLEKKLKVKEKISQIKELEEKSLKQDFWKDHIKAAAVMKELADFQDEVQTFKNLLSQLESDLSAKEMEAVKKKIKELETKTFLSGKYDRLDAILSIHAGQGGTEACDWAQMLMRMYLRYAQKKGWQFQVLDERPGEEAGIKSAVLEIKGLFVYGLLKNEKGAHRLVRLSPFNADSLRQTSFALVEVLPVFKEEEGEVEIKDDDIQFESFRSSGHGGQNVNKVATAVRIKHKPTNITVECQSQRRQEQNRKIAMQILRAKLWQLREIKKQENLKKIKGVHKIAGWGNQIRSYVLHPYKMVKDLRTGYEEKNPDAVLDGSLEGFIQSGLKNC